MDANIKNLQDAMEWLDHSIRKEAELDDEMSNDHAIQLGFIQNMLAKFPRRNCDVGTPDEQAKRFEDFCIKHLGCAEETGGRHCLCCPLVKASEKITQKCELYWAQMPYEEEGAK